MRIDVKKKQYQQGFTLLEVMVALAILALVAVSAGQASRSYLQSVQTIEKRTFAHFVAENILADLRIQQTWITYVDTRQIESQGQFWQVTITPHNTQVETIKQINIAVAPVENGVVKNNVTTLEAMMSKPVEKQP